MGRVATDPGTPQAQDRASAAEFKASVVRIYAKLDQNGDGQVPVFRIRPALLARHAMVRAH